MPTALSGWGRYPVVPANVVISEDLVRGSEGAVLSRGLGRAYGDAALPPVGSRGAVLLTTRADRILAFDAQTGVIRAEAGLSLGDLVRRFLPRGFFTPVSPGTQYVTLGGMVASDIHGKNHHCEGTFGRAVRSLLMRVADGRILTVSRDQEPELFRATLGGMGLTGHILEVEVQLARVPSPWIYEESQRYGTFDEVFTALGEASRQWPMTVAWIDTSARGRARGRGIVMSGRWAEPAEAPADIPPFRQGLEVPPIFPSGVTNPLSFRMANWAYYSRHPAHRVQHVVAPSTYFWVLDLVREWNRGYGGRGFTQYQCVLPSDAELFQRFLDRFQRLGGTSFVTVLKDCGDAGEGLLSFPQRGTSLALDIPIGSIARMERLVDELNAFVIEHGGRVYLAKDAFTTAARFRAMYPQWEAFQALRDRWDPQRLITSAQAVRLLGDPSPSTPSPT
jgi:decaprenylphospho-beta-D-ribofuranose 2-oxidase